MSAISLHAATRQHIRVGNTEEDAEKVAAALSDFDDRDWEAVEA